MKKIAYFFSTILLLCGSVAYAQIGDPPPEAAPPVVDGKYRGLQLARTKLIERLLVSDSTLNFKPESLINNMPTLVAHGIKKSIVTIVGTEYNIRKVIYKVFVLPGDEASVKEGFIRAGMTVGSVIPTRNLMNWLFRIHYNIEQYPSKDIKESYSQSGNLIKVDYNHTLKSITVAIETEYN